MDYSIVIANWNGEAFIARACASLEAAMRSATGEGEVLVVDDASEDDSPGIVERRFSGFRLLRNQRNAGFAATVNRGLEEARGERVILLNNDIVVRADFVSNVLAPFAAPGADDLFAVTAKTLQWTTGEANHACMNGHWRRGWIDLEWSQPAKISPSLFIQAGACALRRAWALDLGGLRELYRPGYWEDYDLSYRAARRGWRSLYHPAAVAYHLGKASLERRYGADGVRALRLRNEMLFYWSNLDDASLIAGHAFGLVRRITRDLARGDFGSFKAALKALGRLAEVLRARHHPSRSHLTTGDRNLLE